MTDKKEKYIMRVWYQVQGGHTHVRIFTGKVNCTLGKAGDLCMTNEEFEAWKNNTMVHHWREEK